MGEGPLLAASGTTGLLDDQKLHRTIERSSDQLTCVASSAGRPGRTLLWRLGGVNIGIAASDRRVTLDSRTVEVGVVIENHFAMAIDPIAANFSGRRMTARDLLRDGRFHERELRLDAELSIDGLLGATGKLRLSPRWPRACTQERQTCEHRFLRRSQNSSPPSRPHSSRSDQRWRSMQPGGGTDNQRNAPAFRPRRKDWSGRADCSFSSSLLRNKTELSSRAARRGAGEDLRS
jgi:hypothetical protein